jgi:TPR repeat protein
MKPALKHALAAIILLSLAAPVAAGPLEEGNAAHNKSDYATALRLLRPLANQGNADAQNNLGVMYSKGQGVPQNYAEAAKWFRLAADQGRAVAQFNLGLKYDKGDGVPQNYAEAMKWLSPTADVPSHTSGQLWPCAKTLVIFNGLFT